MAVTETGQVAARAVDDLYRLHVGEVYRYAYAVLGNRADAEDVTQTTFLNAYRSLEQGVRPRKAANWLLTIASNAIKQRFRQELARPRHVALDDRIADLSLDDDAGPSVGELLTALSRIPPSQRQAIVLREFEGRSYKEIAEILDVTTSALETLLFRARRSLADELEHQLTCTEAQHAVSRAVDDRLGRKERRRLRDHLVECPDCAQFVASQKRHRTAFKGLMLLPIPLSLTFFKGIEGTAAAATLPAAAAGTAAVGVASTAAVGAGAGVGMTTATGGGIFAGGLAVKAAAVVTAAGVAGGVGVVGSSNVDSKPGLGPPPARADQPGKRLGQVAPRGVLVPGWGVARGKSAAPGQANRESRSRGAVKSKARPGARGRSADAKATAPGQNKTQTSAEKNANAGKIRERTVPSSSKVPNASTETKLPKTNDRAGGGKTR